jgi:hypothetical protein
MPFKVQVGPHQAAGQTLLVSDPDGQINWPSEKGLYFFDTRVISSWAIYANGEPWILLNGGAVTHYASRTYLTNRSIPTADGVIPDRTLGLVISRMINGGLHEDLDLTNNSMRRIRFQLEIALRCDFADIFEVKSNNIVRRGRITTDWSQIEQRLWRCWPLRCAPTSHGLRLPSSSRARLAVFSAQVSPPSALGLLGTMRLPNGSGAINASPPSAALPPRLSWV